VYWQHRFECE